jgi:hypothetical protein
VSIIIKGVVLWSEEPLRRLGDDLVNGVSSAIIESLALTEKESRS